MSRKKSSQSKETSCSQIYFYCEGETEKAYCKLIKEVLHDKFPSQSITIEKVSIDKDPKKICEIIEEKKTTFFIFDTEEGKEAHIHRIRLCKKLHDENRKYKNCYAIESFPCLELWFLHHISDKTPHTYVKIEEALKKEFFSKENSKYEKNKTLDNNNTDKVAKEFREILQKTIKQELKKSASSEASKNGYSVNHKECSNCEGKECRLEPHTNMPFLFEKLIYLCTSPN